MLRCLFVFLLSLFCSLGAHAQVQEFEHQAASCGVVGKTLGQWGSEILQLVSNTEYTAGATWITAPYFDSASGMLRCTGLIQKKFNGSNNGVQGVGTDAVCPSGWSVDLVAKDCSRPKIKTCPIGSKKQMELFKGWFASVSDPLVIPGTETSTNFEFLQCENGCAYKGMSVVSCQAETTPSANGHFRGTCTYENVSDGTSCTTGSSPPPDTPDPPPAGPPDPNPNPNPDPNPGPNPGGDPGSNPGGGGPNGPAGTNPDGTPCGGSNAACGSSGGGSGGTTGGVTCGVAGTPACTTGGGGNGNGTGTDDTSDDWGTAVEANRSYDKKSKTFDTVLNGASAAFGQTPLGQGVGGFFNVSVGGGSCTPWTATIPYLNVAMTIDVFCAPWVADIAPIIKAALLVVAAFAAFRVAFL